MKILCKLGMATVVIIFILPIIFPDSKLAVIPLIGLFFIISIWGFNNYANDCVDTRSKKKKKKRKRKRKRR